MDRFGHGESQSIQTRKMKVNCFLIMCMDGEYTVSCFNMFLSKVVPIVSSLLTPV